MKYNDKIINALIIASLARTFEPELYRSNFNDAIFIAKIKLNEKRIFFNKDDFKFFCQYLISETVSVQHLIKKFETENSENQE
jgi:hypothetical protein